MCSPFSPPFRLLLSGALALELATGCDCPFSRVALLIITILVSVVAEERKDIGLINTAKMPSYVSDSPTSVGFKSLFIRQLDMKLDLLYIYHTETMVSTFDPAAHLHKQGWKGKGTGE